MELLLFHPEALFFTVSMKCEFLALITRCKTRQTKPAVRHPTCEETRLHRHRSLHRADLSPYLRRRPFISRHRAAANRRLICHLWCVCITESWNYARWICIGHVRALSSTACAASHLYSLITMLLAPLPIFHVIVKSKFTLPLSVSPSFICGVNL